MTVCGSSRAGSTNGALAAAAIIVMGIAALSARPAIAAEAGAPQRQAGWWEFRTGPDHAGPSEEQMCIGPRSEAVFSSFEQLAPADWCPTREFHRDGGDWAFSSVCDYGAGPVTTTGTISGDLSRDYNVHLQVDKTTGDLQARWVGAGPAGTKEGDRVISGFKINVLGVGL
jgi:hypothetical protein